MPGRFHHEELYRGHDLLARLGQLRVTLCGAGALGSHLADNLVRQGVRQLKIIDRDRVEEQNVNTQLYCQSDVGAWKGDVLRSHLFRAVGVEIETHCKELNEKNRRKLLKNSELVINTFDNSESRRLVCEYCHKEQVTCLNVGLFTDYCEIIWNENYRVPEDGDLEICDYPLARNLVWLAVTLASETLLNWLATGEKRSRSATLKDFQVQDLETRIE